MVIEIIGSVGGDACYTTEQIVSFLKTDHTELNYGSQFMGRPSTRLYSGDADIVKLRSELKLNAKKLRNGRYISLNKNASLLSTTQKKLVYCRVRTR